MRTIHSQDIDRAKTIDGVGRGVAKLSIVLIGHPKLKNDLKRPTMGEIGDRMTVFEFGGLRDQQREYIAWALGQCLAEGVAIADVLTDEAIAKFATKLETPLQIGRHLVRAFEAGLKAGVKPIDATFVAGVLSARIDDLEPQLTRHGYDTKSIADQFGAKPAEVVQLFRNRLDAGRARASWSMRCAPPGYLYECLIKRASVLDDLASVSSIVRPVSRNVRRPPLSVSR